METTIECPVIGCDFKQGPGAGMAVWLLFREHVQVSWPVLLPSSLELIQCVFQSVHGGEERLSAAAKEQFIRIRTEGNSRNQEVRDKCFPKPEPPAHINSEEHMVGLQSWLLHCIG